MVPLETSGLMALPLTFLPDASEPPAGRLSLFRLPWSDIKRRSGTLVNTRNPSLRSGLIAGSLPVRPIPAHHDDKPPSVVLGEFHGLGDGPSPIGQASATQSDFEG
jgi:hypothetical protein